MWHQRGDKRYMIGILDYDAGNIKSVEKALHLLGQETVVTREPEILLKADKMSMANSLELRVPFLDKEVMAVAERIPTKYRVTDENTKFAMRKAALRSAPPQTANKKKLGFPVPIRVWLKEDKYYGIVKEHFTSPTAEHFFNTELLIKLLDDHRNGKADNSRKIWTIFIFLVWYKVYFE